MNTALPPSPATAAAPVAIRDFSERLSPIVVKELRQGLRQPTFVVAFLCLQVLLCIVVMTSVLNAPDHIETNSRVGATVSGFFFVLLGLVILVVQPLRGLTALANEVKADTLDLLLLTKLNSWRITFGKWLALASQSALLVVAVLPYLILRYYLGGMQLFGELLSLLTLFLVSLSLTGITVGFSATTSIVVRGLLGIGLILLTFTMPQFLRFSSMRGGSPFALVLTDPAAWRTYAGIMLVLLFCGYYFLEMGATQISPPAENRSTRKRLVGWVMLAAVAALLPKTEVLRLSGWLLVTTLLMIDALSERPDLTASVLRSFRRCGPARRVAGLFFLPGWQSGLNYCALLMLLTVGMVWQSLLFEPRMTYTPYGVSTPDTKPLVFSLLLFAVVLFPAVITHWFIARAKNIFGMYVVVTLGSFVLGLVLFIIGEATNSETEMLGLIPVCPPLGFFLMAEVSREFTLVATGGWIATSMCGAYWVLLAVRSLAHWRRIRAMDQQSSPTTAATLYPAETLDAS